MTNTTTQTTTQITQTEWSKNKRKWRCLRLADKRVFVISASKSDRAKGDANYTIKDDADFLRTAKTLASARQIAADYLTI